MDKPKNINRVNVNVISKKIKTMVAKLNCQYEWYESSLNNQIEVTELIKENLKELDNLLNKL